MTAAESQHNDTKLSRDVTVSQYQMLESDRDRVAIADFIQKRFTERYITPLRGDPVHVQKNGFCTMAICCLMIEALESFWQGQKDSKNISKSMFVSFFDRQQDGAPLAQFHSDSLRKDFFKHVRCGILHQAETTDGWHIRRDGDLFDESSKRINATKFHNALEECLINYCNELRMADWGDDVWVKARAKLKAICDNCA